MMVANIVIFQGYCRGLLVFDFYLICNLRSDYFHVVIYWSCIVNANK